MVAFLSPSTSSARLASGAAAGIVGGLAFGAMMHMAGMMPMVAALVGSQSVAVGWVVHLVLSAVFGLAFGAVVAPEGPGRVFALGLAWGVVLWAVAAMVVMRSILGAPIAFDDAALGSLAGHLVYGALVGIVYPFAARAWARAPGGRPAA